MRLPVGQAFQPDKYWSRISQARKPDLLGEKTMFRCLFTLAIINALFLVITASSKAQRGGGMGGSSPFGSGGGMAPLGQAGFGATRFGGGGMGGMSSFGS